MKWKIQSEKDGVRLWENDKDNWIIQTDVIYTDALGETWWGFHDLFQIPYLRVAYSKSNSDLFAVGMTPDDVRHWIKQEKELLRAAKDDPEKYEKLYALVLQKEAIVEATVDPLNQHLSLCTIYVLAGDENIGHYTLQMAAEKVARWKLDPDACDFFLSWHTQRMGNFMQGLSNLSEIASNLRSQTEMKAL